MLSVIPFLHQSALGVCLRVGSPLPGTPLPIRQGGRKGGQMGSRRASLATSCLPVAPGPRRPGFSAGVGDLAERAASWPRSRDTR